MEYIIVLGCIGIFVWVVRSHKKFLQTHDAGIVKMRENLNSIDVSFFGDDARVPHHIDIDVIRKN